MSYRISFLLAPGFALMSYASAIEPLRAANLLSGRALFTWRHVAPEGARVASTSGAEIPCEEEAGSAAIPDLLLVVAGGRPERFRHLASLGFIRRTARAGAAVGGISGGPVILAAAGVMAGWRMTVHWEHAEALAEAHPGLALARALYVIDGPRLTSAGGAAPMDMMLALIGSRHGADLATRVSDWFHHIEIRPPAGRQRARGGGRHPLLAAAFDLIEANVAQPLTRAEAAARLGVSERRLGRLFQEHAGRGFAAACRGIRLEKARELSRQTAMPLAEIAYACGFSSPSHLSTAYRAAYGLSPSSDRG
ncbi:MAG: GlxA family transcriptional regulator [Pikeienuella sp.]